MGDRPGIIDTPNLGLKKGTSRGFMDNKTQGQNWDVLDGNAGAMRVYRFLPAFDPTALVPDTPTFVPLLSPELAALGVGPPGAEFDFFIRNSNVFKVLCARMRTLAAAGGPLAKMTFELKKNPWAAPAAGDPDCLINPIVFDDDNPAIQNRSGFGVGVPQTPVFGKDGDALGLWCTVNPGWVSTPLDIEVIVTLQMLPELPPVEIIEL
jgi:hypothetical protein